MALSTGTDVAFDLLDQRGRIVCSFEQATTWDADTSAYEAALNAPLDDCMERQEERAREHNRRLHLEAVARREEQARKERDKKLARWRRQALQPALTPGGRRVPLPRYKSAPRPSGNVVEF